MNRWSHHAIALMEQVMNTAIAEHLEASSVKTAAAFDGLLSVAIFSGVGLLISISVILLDKYIPGEWF